MHFFFELMIILLATKIAGDISVRLGQPAVLGKLLIGIVIGPAVLGLVHDTEILQQISQIGVLLLMFIAGLETDLEELNRNRTTSIATAVGGVLLPLLGGYLGGILFGMSNEHALFLGVLLGATSVSITVQTLKELGALQSREGSTILGAALLDDVLVVVMLAGMMGFITSMDTSVALLLGKMLLFFVLAFLIGWKLVPWILRSLAPLQVTESIITAGFILCLFFAYLAELLGVAGIIGAFAAGIAISQTRFKEEVEEKIQPIAYGVFVPVFFVSIGAQVSFDGIGGHIGFIVVLSLIAILSKWFGAGIGARLTGFSTLSSLRIGAGMISRGEVALILAALGLESQLLSQSFFTSVLIVVIVTTIATPPLLKWLFPKPTHE